MYIDLSTRECPTGSVKYKYKYKINVLLRVSKLKWASMNDN